MKEPVERLIAEINPKLRGWVNYFRIRHASRCFAFVRLWVEKRVWRHLMTAGNRRGLGWKRRSTAWLHATLGKTLELAELTSPATRTSVSKIGIEIQASSLRELASRQGLDEDVYLRSLAAGYKKRLAETLETISLLDMPPTAPESVRQVILSQQIAFDRLDDPRYVLEYRQAELEGFYDGLLARLEEWLQRSSEDPSDARYRSSRIS
jgi:hypothetical protein